VSVVLGCCWTCEEEDTDEFDDGEVVTEVVVAENELIFCVPGVVVVVDVSVLPGMDPGV
jgi:hypothetical protein